MNINDTTNRFAAQVAPTPATTSAITPTDSTEQLIAEWSVRVLEFRSRVSQHPVTGRDEARLVRAFRVRDQLNNRLRHGGRSSASCSARMSRVLASADEMLRDLTEGDTTTALTAHGHYAKASEWWWNRVLVGSSINASAA